MLTDRDYRAVFEASPDAMLIVDSSGVIRDLNPQALSMFGWSREEMVGSGVERLVPAASRGRHERHRRRYAEAPRPRPMGQGLELQAVRRDGTAFPVEISLSPGKLASGLEHVICTIRDITSWKRMRWLSRMKLKAAENERKHLSASCTTSSFSSSWRSRSGGNSWWTRRTGRKESVRGRGSPTRFWARSRE